ncbi:P27 family phage terminase small subunit [Aureimonas mangrovi]|uniref:P27 family phage terminase small subunit n=1 Tax=Aureimonas mangrovi TaxID=2758041 RepID=UPI00163D9A8A|nr:P27 family phage terminase small subunit [Aureimonas mangrovi]
MGRRKQDPSLQKAQGYPGRRKRRTDHEIEAAADSAEREAPADPFAVPSIFRAAPAYYRRATEIWGGQADTLRAAGRRRPGYRHALTRYCIWSQMYEAAAERLRKDCPKGQLTVEWTPVNGTVRIIPHPSIKIMGDIELKLRALEDDFGFTPRADINLVRVETFNRSQQADLFTPASPNARGAEADQRDGDPHDLMTETDSAPPARLN